jgi:hypothetical protein
MYCLIERILEKYTYFPSVKIAVNNQPFFAVIASFVDKLSNI